MTPQQQILWAFVSNVMPVMSNQRNPSVFNTLRSLLCLSIVFFQLNNFCGTFQAFVTDNAIIDDNIHISAVADDAMALDICPK